jgi:hypothetical protein
MEKVSVAKKARSLDAGSGTVRRLSGMRPARRSPRIEIFGVCSMVKCSCAPIAAMKLSDFWVSMCLKHSKGHGKMDLNKVTPSSSR